MAKSLDHVLQADGTYKWELTELKAKTQESVEASSASESKATKKKVAKKKTTSPLSD